MPLMPFDSQVAIVGGGLAGSLVAYRLKQLFPELSLQLLEGSSALGGNHTWSFHQRDVAKQDWQWIKALVRKSWQGYFVKFPQFERRFSSSYHSISNETLHDEVAPFLQSQSSLQLNKPVRSLQTQKVEFKDATAMSAEVVIDARGFENFDSRKTGFQKFVGWEVELDEAHGLEVPTIKDVTCEQLDGYRFFYLLPWSEKTLLIEDTRYSDGPEIDVASFEKEIQRYIVKRGWKLKQILRREVAALPIPMYPDFAPAPQKDILTIGVRAGFFNSTTGYSIPDAVRVASGVADVFGRARNDGRYLHSEIQAFLTDYQSQVSKREKYFRLLNRMLFQAAEPQKRYAILQRFYRLPVGLVERFYSGQLSWADQARILMGKPPVPVHRALGCLRDSLREASL